MPHIITIRCTKPTPEQKGQIDAALQKIDVRLNSHLGATHMSTAFWVEGPDSYAVSSDETDEKIAAARTAVWLNF